MSFSRHFIKLLLFTLILTLANLLLNRFEWMKPIALASWISLLLFFILTGGSLWYIIKTLRQKKRGNQNVAMYINMFFKLIISLIAFVVLIQYFPEQKKMIAIPFMIYYFFYTTFEMVLIYTLKRPGA